MSDIQSVQVFAGSVESAGATFQGLRAPATLTLIERAHQYECRFVFFVGGAMALTFFAPKSGTSVVNGIAQDPRGWDVSFEAELQGSRVSGSFVQPHDRGTFVLDAV